MDMEITIKGTPKEIAALVLEVQERQGKEGVTIRLNEMKESIKNFGVV